MYTELFYNNGPISGGIPGEQWFENFYNNKVGDKIGIVIATEDNNPDTMGLCMGRIFIEKSAKLTTDQKFILAITTYGFGDICLVDIISLDKGFHREMVKEHTLCMTGETLTLIPFIMAGGHISQVENKINVFGSSGDFGNDIVSQNAVDIASYILHECGFEIESPTEKGEEFFEKFTAFLSANKLSKDFYNRFASSEFIKTNFTSTQLEGLLYLAARDRASTENISMIEATIAEMAGGAPRTYFVNKVAEKIRAGKED